MICMLADVFSNFQNVCQKVYELELSLCTRISMATSLKKDQSKFRSINWYWYVINGIREGMCLAICWYAIANGKYMKDHDEDKESS